jgi:hypothetical protein
MIGGRSDQMVLLPFISTGPARIAWTRNHRRARHQRARAPPGGHQHRIWRQHPIAP